MTCLDVKKFASLKKKVDLLPRVEANVITVESSIWFRFFAKWFYFIIECFKML